MAVLIILLCVFNLVMWLLAIVRFRKIFSTDDIVEKTRQELNNMMMEINRNAERNVTLLEDRIQKLKDIIADTDKHIELLKGEIQTVEKTNVFQSRLMGIDKSSRKEGSVETKSYGIQPEEESVESMVPVAERKTKTVQPRLSARTEGRAIRKTAVKDAAQEMDSTKTVSRGRPRGPLAAYQYEQKVATKSASGLDLGGVARKDDFSQELDDIVRKSSFEIEDTVPEVSSGKKLSPEGPEIIISPNPIRPKKSKKDQVLDLAATGMSVEEIAQHLRTTITEVEFILDMA